MTKELFDWTERFIAGPHTTKGEAEKLSELLDMARRRYSAGDMFEDLTAGVVEITASADAEIRDLREALEPFATAAESICLKSSGGSAPPQVYVPHDTDVFPAGQITWGHVRRAAEAVSASLARDMS